MCVYIHTSINGPGLDDGKLPNQNVTYVFLGNMVEMVTLEFQCSLITYWFKKMKKIYE